MREAEVNLYWKTVVDTLQDGVMIVDRAGTIVFANRALQGITGFSQEEMLDTSCSILGCNVCERVLDRKGAHWCSLFRDAGVTMRRCTLRKKDGSAIPVLKNASLLLDPEGKVTGAVETLTDLTEIVQKENQIEAFRKALGARDGFHGMIGQSPAMEQVFYLISNAAQSDAPVLILGESGTGKELVARAIHDLGPRNGRAYVKVNCAALTETLLESELFGHVKGAYTGAYRSREGRFEAAQGGDIFLDEIGDLPLSTQVKLLRVLEEKVIERVGDNRPVPIDVRIISATNKNLKDLVEEGAFRSDLFFRINVIPILMPALRERKEDIPFLAEAFFKGMQLKTGKPIQGMAPESMEALMSYDWPGNVRELRSAFEYAFVTCQETLIQPHHLPGAVFSTKKARPRPQHAAADRKEEEKTQLLRALEQAGGNRSLAAQILGVSRVTVWNRMKRCGIRRG